MSGSRGFTRNLHTAKTKPAENEGIDDQSSEEEASESLVCAETSIVTLDTIELLVEVSIDTLDSRQCVITHSQHK